MTKNLWFAKCWNQGKVSLSIIYDAKKHFLQKKELLKEKGSRGLNKKMKRRLFNCSHYGNKKYQ